MGVDWLLPTEEVPNWKAAAGTDTEIGSQVLTKDVCEAGNEEA
jgi:hypothetical protein